MIKRKRKNPSKKLLILDIDNTLLYLDRKEKFKAKKLWPEFIIDKDYYGVTRPFLNKFLTIMNKKFDLALWTTGNETYANQISELIIDPLNIKLVFIWSGENCSPPCKKSLDLVMEEFPYSKKNILALDDSPMCYQYDPDNLIHIKKFIGDPNDEELLRIIELLKDE